MGRMDAPDAAEDLIAPRPLGASWQCILALPSERGCVRSTSRSTCRAVAAGLMTQPRSTVSVWWKCQNAPASHYAAIFCATASAMVLTLCRICLAAAGSALAAALWLSAGPIANVMIQAGESRDEMLLAAIAVLGSIVYFGAVVLLFGRNRLAALGRRAPNAGSPPRSL